MHDSMPPRPPRLRVTARCTCHRGCRVTLRKQEPQGINPRDLLLELVEEDGDAEEYVEYVEEAGADDYATVSILPDGPSGLTIERVT